MKISKLQLNAIFGSLMMALALLPSTSFAAAGSYKIDKIRVYADSNLIIGSVTPEWGEYQSGCTANDWALETTTSEQRESALKILMTGYLTNKPVYMAWKATCGAWNRNEIDYLELR